MSLSDGLLFAGRAFDLALARAAGHFVLAAIFAIFGHHACQHALAEGTQFFFGGAQGIGGVIRLRKQGVVGREFGPRRIDERLLTFML